MFRPIIQKEKRRGFPRRFDRCLRIRAQRRSWSTLCWLWLASASADTAIDWRVDRASLLSAFSLVLARMSRTASRPVVILVALIIQFSMVYYHSERCDTADLRR